MYEGIAVIDWWNHERLDVMLVFGLLHIILLIKYRTNMVQVVSNKSIEINLKKI